MADEEKKFDADIRRINELARSIFKKKEAGENWGATFEFEQLYHLLIKRSKSIKVKEGNIYIKDEDIRNDACDRAILKTLKTYDGAKDFLPLYRTVFTNNVIDNFRPEKKYKEVCHLDEECIDSDGNSQGPMHNTIPDKTKNISKQVEERDIINSIMLSIAALVRKIRKNEIHYSSLFFTDRLVYAVFDSEAWFDEIVQRNSNKFDEAVVNEFMNSLLTGECDSVTEINKFECRPLSDFTGKQRDIDKPCCDKEPNYHVFNCFLKEYDRGISQSAFSQQKEKYFNMLKPIKEEIGYFS